VVINKGREEFKVYKNVFDQFTIQTLWKFISTRYIDGLVGPVKIGKESNVFLAEKGDLKVIVKIYRLQSCNFNKMFDYLKSDPRYVNLKKQRRKVIFKWVQREFGNLKSAAEVIRVPKAYKFFNNVVLMEFIGDKERAPQLKDSYPQDPEKFFRQIMDYVKRLHDVGLVHADLSEYNILNYNQSPVFIDFSQGTSTRDILAQEYLERDIRNVCHFFTKNGLSIDVEREIGIYK
jgi:RIO kinase 1